MTGNRGRDDVVTTYAVRGMTCAHCTGAVRRELAALPGVQSVRIDLVVGGTSPVTVVWAGAPDRAAVAGAVDEAGYELADQ